MYNIPSRWHFFFHVFAIYLIDPTVISNTSPYMLLQLRESEVYTARLFGMYAVFCFPTLQNILLQLQNVCVMCFLDQRTPIFSIWCRLLSSYEKTLVVAQSCFLWMYIWSVSDGVEGVLVIGMGMGAGWVRVYGNPTQITLSHDHTRRVTSL